MIKAIIFDFDGVIVESVDIKAQAFAELFSAYPEKVKEIVEYHLANGGISRYIKFVHIYERILGQELSREKEIELGDRFSQLVVDKVLNAPFVAGAKEFLTNYKSKYKLFIASGTPQQELDDIVCSRGLKEHFMEVYGSPKSKLDIINEIVKKHGFSLNEVVYVGDAESDRIAAWQARVVFIERKHDSESDISWRIKDMSGLSHMLEKIEKSIIKRSR